MVLDTQPQAGHPVGQRANKAAVDTLLAMRLKMALAIGLAVEFIVRFAVGSAVWLMVEGAVRIRHVPSDCKHRTAGPAHACLCVCVWGGDLARREHSTARLGRQNRSGISDGGNKRGNSGKGRGFIPLFPPFVFPPMVPYLVRVHLDSDLALTT